jgi:hypothetical protein
MVLLTLLPLLFAPAAAFSSLRAAHHVTAGSRCGTLPVCGAPMMRHEAAEASAKPILARKPAAALVPMALGAGALLLAPASAHAVGWADSSFVQALAPCPSC